MRLLLQTLHLDENTISVFDSLGNNPDDDRKMAENFT